MGYQITYDRGTARKRRILLGKIMRKRLVMGAVLFIFALILALPAGRIWMRDLLLPGNEAVTAAALEGLVENLRQGQSFAEAASAFCHQVIYGS